MVFLKNFPNDASDTAILPWGGYHVRPVLGHVGYQTTSLASFELIDECLVVFWRPQFIVADVVHVNSQFDRWNDSRTQLAGGRLENTCQFDDSHWKVLKGRICKDKSKGATNCFVNVRVGDLANGVFNRSSRISSSCNCICFH